jgi:hypothetical protein
MVVALTQYLWFLLGTVVGIAVAVAPARVR